jgi:short-subunit dehydrogenase
MLFCNWFRVGLGKRNTKMAIENKEKAILLLGASGGIGAELLHYLSSRTIFLLIPTFNQNKPENSLLNWFRYDSKAFKTNYLLFESIFEQYEITTVIDATGAFYASRIQNASFEEINEVISTNLTGPLILAKHSQSLMKEGGKLIFLSSVVGTLNLTGSSVYAASKAGLERAIMSLSPEFSKTGHSICALRLGYMNYGMTYKIDEVSRKKILENLDNKEFIDIALLGEQILRIIASECSETNGRVYEVF